MYERMREWAYQGVSTDIMTMILRSEGALDSDIAACYDRLLQSGQFDIRLERGIAVWYALDTYF